MWEYLQINLGLFALGGLTLVLLKKSPARVRFFLCLVMLGSWLVPWQLLNIPLPENIAQTVKLFKVYELKDITHLFQEDVAFFQNTDDEQRVEPLPKTDAASVVTTQLEVQYTLSQYIPPLTYWVISLFSIGFLLLVRELRSYRNMLERWQALSKPADKLKEIIVDEQTDNIEIRHLVSPDPGMTTGIFKPTIWISEEISDPDMVKSILIHELTHIKNHDLAWLWFVNAMDKIFWWNPIVQYLCRYAKDQMELSCDEAAETKLEKNSYMKSLARLVLFNGAPASEAHGALTVKASKKLNVKRLQWLNMHKKFTKNHAAALSFFAVSGFAVCAVFAYDLRLRDFFSEQQGSFEVRDEQNITIRYHDEEQQFYEFMALVNNRDFAEAEMRYHHLVEVLKTESIARRRRGFHMLAAYLGESDQHARIPKLFDALLPTEESWTGIRMPRSLGITYLILGEYDKVIHIIRKAEEAIGSYRGYPDRLLMAQAYHLKGEYQKSSELVEDTLQRPVYSFYKRHRISLIKLLGKNGVKLNDSAMIARAQDLMGLAEPYDFASVKVKNHKVPHAHFLYSHVNGVAISGFDSTAFPLRDTLPKLETPELQSLYSSAIRKARFGAFEESKEILEHAIKLANRGKHIKSDKTRLMEYLFVVNMRLENVRELRKLSRRLIKQEGVSRDIKARAYWTLASGKYRYSYDGMFYFEKYLDMLGQPTLATDHEMLERFYLRGEAEKVIGALERVTGFYEKSGITPDLRTLNRIIGAYVKLGDKENEQRYRAMFAEAYPNTLDFSLDKPS